MQPGLDAGDVQAAIRALQSVLAKHHNPHRNLFERELNTLGYALLDQRRATDAVAVLQLVTELYPQSWNAWDSLGEAQVMSRQRGPAAFSYARSVHLNPSNAAGAAALQRLLQRRN
jgi:tetratricopeptide (TPR) repeat protein